jgi:hypothetical protein
MGMPAYTRTGCFTEISNVQLPQKPTSPLPAVACGRFAFQKRNMCMGFGIFFGDTQIKNMWLQHKTFWRNFEMRDGVVRFGIQHFGIVGGQVLAQMHIIAVATQAFTVIGFDFDAACRYFF